jgi:AraC-like DNA-binding protein
MCFSTPFIINSPSGILRGDPGDFIINRPNNFFWHTNAEKSETGFVNCWCSFSSGDMPEFLDRYDLSPDKIYHTVDSNIFINDLTSIKKEIYDRRYYSDDIISLFANKMIIDLSRENKIYRDKYEITVKRLSEINQLRDYMLANYAKQYSVKDLAKELDLSVDYFFVLYKKIFKISPIKDLCLKRISAAKMLLISTDMTVQEIAKSCGYTNINYFSRVFKKIEGNSPLTYRK